jgi:hypothetical protein
VTGRHKLLTLGLAGAVGLGCGVRRSLAPDDGAAPRAPRARETPPPPDAVAPPPPDPAARPSCASELPPRVALASVEDDNVSFVMSDGSSRVVYHFPTVHAVEPSVTVVAAGRDVFATWTLFGPTEEQPCELKDGLLECPETDRLVRLDLDGHVLWEKALAGRASSASIGVDARGEVVRLLPPPSAARRAWSIVDEGDVVVRTNPVTGEAERIVLTLPAGMRPLGPSSVDQEGALARVLRDDAVGSAYLSHDGTSWTPLGRTLGEVETGDVQDVGGTYLVTARGTNSFFVPTQTWAAAPDGGAPELRGDSVQLLRPSTGLAALAAAHLFIGLTSDGLCAAYVETGGSGERFVIHDLARDVRTPVLGVHAGGVVAFALIE